MVAVVLGVVNVAPNLRDDEGRMLGEISSEGFCDDEDEEEGVEVVTDTVAGLLILGVEEGVAPVPVAVVEGVA